MALISFSPPPAPARPEDLRVGARRCTTTVGARSAPTNRSSLADAAGVMLLAVRYSLVREPAMNGKMLDNTTHVESRKHPGTRRSIKTKSRRRRLEGRIRTNILYTQ